MLFCYAYFLLAASAITATAFYEPFSMILRYGTKQGTIKDLLRLSAKQICLQLEVGKHALNLQARGRNRHFLSRLVPKFGRHRSLDCLERKVCKFTKTSVIIQLSIATFIKNRNDFNLHIMQLDVGLGPNVHCKYLQVWIRYDSRQYLCNFSIQVF